MTAYHANRVRIEPRLGFDERLQGNGADVRRALVREAGEVGNHRALR